MFSSIGGKSSFYNKSLMDYSLKSTNDYIKRIIEKSNDKKNQFKIDKFLKEDDLLKENQKELNKLDEISSLNFKPIHYFPFFIFLSISSYILLKK